MGASALTRRLMSKEATIFARLMTSSSPPARTGASEAPGLLTLRPQGGLQEAQRLFRTNSISTEHLCHAAYEIYGWTL